MNTSSTHNINVTDNGTTTKVVKNVQGLNAELNTAANNVKKLAAAQNKGALSQAQGQASQDSGMSRGIGGMTGAAGRDFAKQAQGLGGLVHVYATFAANIFAVSAAFTALSKAADTTNMIKGLDQLGAQSGRALGSLSKQLVAATDGAISLRDAMTATALASSGGMSDSSITKMALVAKQASQALGIAMPDAMSRLSRGITKLEPELLDEIGIFVRVDKASQEYARTLGKSATALTDFEKRQAFANAVLEQGAAKFGAIQMDANPYSKLLATFQNVAQTGLELVNKVLGPLVNMLSQSPTALATVIAGIGSMLLKQAIPAIGMFRSNARIMAEETHKRVAQQVAEQRDAAAHFDSIAAIKAEKEFKLAADTKKRIDSLQKQEFSSKALGRDVRGLLRKNPLDLTDEESRKIENKYKELQDKIANNTASKTENLQYEKLEKRFSTVKKLTEDMTKAGDAAADASEKNDQKWFAHQKLKEAQLDKLTKAAAKSRVLSSVADAADTLGPTIAFRQLREEVDKLDATKFSKTMTTVRGSLSIATIYAGNLINAFSNWAAIAAAAAVGFSLIDGWLTKTAKESKEASEALDKLSDSLENMDRVILAQSKQSPLDKLSTSTITASSTALNNLTDNVTDSLNKTKSYISKIGIWDSIWEGWKMAVGAGTQDKAAQGLSGAIGKILKTATKGPELDKFRKTIADLLNIDPDDQKALDKAIKMENLNKVAPIATKAIDAITASQQKLSSVNKSVDDAFTVALKTYDTIVAGLAPSDNIGKLGIEVVKVADELAKALKDPIASITQLVSIVKDSSKLKLFDPKFAEFAIKSQNAIENTVKSLENAKSDMQALEKTKLDKNLELQNLYNEKASGGFVTDKEISDLEKQVNTLGSQISFLKGYSALRESDIKKYTAEFNNGVTGAFIKGADLVSKSIGIEFAKAQITIDKAYSQGISGTSGGISMAADIDRASISLQQAQLDVSVSMAATMEKIRLYAEAADIDREKQSAKNDPAKLAELVARENSNKISQGIVAVGKNAFSIVTNLLKNGTDEEKAAARGSFDYSTKVQGSQAQKAQLGAQSQAITVKEQFDLMTNQVALEKDILATRISKLSVDKSSLDTQAKYAPYLNESIVTAQIANEDASIKLKLQQEELDLADKLIKAYVTRNKYAEGSTKYIQAQVSINELNTANENKQARDKDSAAQREIVNNDKILASKKAELDFQQKLSELKAGTNDISINSELNIKEQSLLIAKELGGITEADLANKTGQLAIDREIQRSAETTRSIKAQQIAIDADWQQKSSTLLGDALVNAATQYQADTARNRANLAAESKLSASKVYLLGVQKEMSTLQAKQTEDMSKMANITESLSSIFGELGNNVGKVGEAILSLAQTDETYLKNKAKLEEKANSFVYSSEEREEASKSLAALEKKNTKDQITNVSILANASKKLFKEETLAYKALDTLEKASHALRIVNMFLELKASLTTAAASLANFLGITAAKDAAAAPGTLMSFVKEYGPTIGVAAGVAFLSSLGVNSGGGGIPAGMTAEEVQKTQGTGTVYGDSEAKSKSLTNSLEILTATSVEGLSYSNESVTLLESINIGIGKVSDAIAGVEGITTGTIKGIVEGSSSSGGGLLSLIFGGSSSSTSVIDSGIRLKGTFLDLANAVENSIKQYNTVATTSSSSGILDGLFGGGGSSTSVSEVNAALPKTILENISGVFSAGRSVFLKQASEVSGSMTPAIVDSVLGTLDISGLVSLRGLKGEALKEEFNSAISAIMDSAAAGLFPQLNKFRKVGEGMSETVTRVLDGNDKVMLSFTSIGKSYTELPETFAAVPKEIKDNYEKAQRDLETAQKGEMQSVITGYTQGEGEYFAQYAEQLVVDQDKVTASTIALQAATALYNTAVNASTTNNIDVTNALIENAGGLDKYLENIKFFGDNFLSEAERLKPIAEKVTNTLASIYSGSLDKFVGPRVPGDSSKGYASDLMKDVSDGKNGVIDTREEFKKLYLAVDVTKEEGRDLIKALDDLAPSFDKTATAAENMTKSKLSQYVQILELLGDKETALAVTRQQELDAMDESLRPAQRYIHALQDRAKAETKVKTIYDKTTSSIKNTTNQIKSLDDAINSLKLGQSSVLTPQQKYAEAKAQIDVLQRAISNTGTDQASVDAKNEALSKLPSATSSFLDASKVLFASGTQYTQDFNSMLGILSSNKTALENQRTLEQQTVDNLKASNSYLADISLNLSDLPAALRELAAANGAVATAGAGVFDPGRAKSIRDYVHTLEWGNPATEANSARSVYGAAQQYGVTQAEIASAMNLPYKDIVEFFAKYGIPAFAKGGLASGLSLVGEQGPELVDFRSPGRVYSAQSSNDMFANSNKELVAEVRALRAEVTKLREEQKEQTGHLIATNYDANAKVAGAVADSVDASTANASWANRSQVKIA